jgi:ribosomal protein S18 acetylase RimI-like enzyme
MPSLVVKLQEMAKNKGFKRLVAYVRQDNKASLRFFGKLAFSGSLKKQPSSKLCSSPEGSARSYRLLD